MKRRGCYPLGSILFYCMAIVVSVSVPDSLHRRWKEADLDISPSALFQTALETELNKSNQHLVYWSTRALNAEKKLQTIQKVLNTPDTEIKKQILIDKITSE